MDKHNRRIYRAWRFKEGFEHFWAFKITWAAERFLKRWTKSALLSRLEPVRKFVGTLRKHQTAVVAFIDTRVTNAIAEGLNRIVKIIKSRASGYRSLDAFSDMISLAVGDLDLPAHIPARFRRTRWKCSPDPSDQATRKFKALRDPDIATIFRL